jgi:hypothetical protein
MKIYFFAFYACIQPVILLLLTFKFSVEFINWLNLTH